MNEDTASDELRTQINELGQLARALFEAQFERADGGRMPADPTWEELEEHEREEWWEQARNAHHVFAPVVDKLRAERDQLSTLRQDETRLFRALGLPEDTDFDDAIAHATTVVRDLARVTNRKQFAEGEVTRLRCALMERHAEYLAHSCSNFPTTPPIAFADLSRPLRKETPDA